MRLCRIEADGAPQPAFYDEQRIVPLAAAADEFRQKTHTPLDLPVTDDLLSYLPGGKHAAQARQLADWVAGQGAELSAAVVLPTDKAHLLVPIPRPNKLLLLAGNYADHIQEGGGVAAERAETFPYVFMKPASTTLTPAGQPLRIPAAAPEHVDWELELAVVIGKTCKGVAENEALQYVAGYTVINDISQRRFRPNPERKHRQRDEFFDWLHGKWFDSFCPCGPCVTSAETIADPQKLAMTLLLNGETRQSGSTGQQIFPVAAVIEFISNIMTLEPGDIISTGTLAGVGAATGTFLKAGDKLLATIESIGTLATPVVAE